MALSVPENLTQRSVRLWIRTFHILSNLILAFLGKGGLIVSIISKMNTSDDLTLLNHYQSMNVNVFLAGSTVLILVGWFGIFAGSKNCYKSTVLNAALLGSFLVNTTVYTITMGVFTDYTQKGDLYRQMQIDMNNYNKTKDIVDKLHSKLSCCGLNGITTWKINKIPTSCYRDIEKKYVSRSPYLQTNGCFKEFIRMSRYYAWLIFSVLIFAGLIEIFAIMLSSVQYSIIKDTQKNRKLSVDSLKIPRPQVKFKMRVENETQNNKKEKEKEKKNGKEEKEEKEWDKVEKERENL